MPEELNNCPSQQSEEKDRKEELEPPIRSEGEEDSPERRNLAYQTYLAGWLTNKLERDKSILALSGGGIAVAVTLITTIGPGSVAMLAVFIISLISFLISLITLVFTFDENASYLYQVIKHQPPDRRLLILLNRLGLWSMLLGAILLSIAGGTAGYSKLQDSRQAHAQEDDKAGVAGKENGAASAIQPTPSIPLTSGITINVAGANSSVTLPNQAGKGKSTKPPCPNNAEKSNEGDIKK